MGLWTLGITLLFIPYTSAQTTNTYIGENKCRLVLAFDDKTNEPVITEKYERTVFFGEDFAKYTSDRIVFSQFEKVSNFDATTDVLVKGKYKTKKLEFSKFIDVLSSGIFYSGYRGLQFNYPQTAKNAIGKSQYHLNISDPHFVNPYYFSSSLFVKKAVYEIEVPKGIEITFNQFSMEEGSYTFHKSTSDGVTLYHWEMENIQPIKSERDGPGISYVAPHIIARVTAINGTPVLKSVNDLYAWYKTLVNQIPTAEPEENERLQKLVNGLVLKTKNSKPDADPETIRRETIRNIYNWVRRNIKYIALEDGMEGFVPRNAYQVYEKRYGDCKDMANLLSTMLNMASIESSLTWIGTRNRPYSYHELPCLITDNHMICYAGKLEGKDLFLDATDPNVPFPFPSAFTQGKEALVAQGDEFKVIKLPVKTAHENIRSDTLVLTLENETLVGVLKSSSCGYPAEKITSLRISDKVEQSGSRLNGYYMGYPKVDYQSIQFDTLISEDQPMFLSEARFKNRITSAGEKLYINLNLYDPYLGEKADLLNRSIPIVRRTTEKYTNQTFFSIPDGYTIDYKPENVKKEYDDFSIQIEYEVVENLIVRKETMIIDYLTLEKDRFSDWNRFLDLMKKYRKEVIVLKKSS